MEAVETLGVHTAEVMRGLAERVDNLEETMSLHRLQMGRWAGGPVSIPADTVGARSFEEEARGEIRSDGKGALVRGDVPSRR